jgi:hypothetical protein
MRKIGVASLLLCLLACAVSHGQEKPKFLGVDSLSVGGEGTPQISAKIFQVIDDKSMLVGIEDPKTGKGTYSTLVMVKCDTKGKVDGKFYGLDWKGMMGANYVKVTGTTTYKTTGGGSKTVFVIEAATKPK